MQSIAEQKKSESIAEYLLFMWQMEDLLRSVNLNLETLSQNILADLPVEEQIRNKKWFGEMIEEMKKNGLHVSGHLAETYEILNELQVLEKALITVIHDEQFMALRESTKPFLAEFKQKLNAVPHSDIEVALTAMYGALILRLAKKEISPETRAAIEKFSLYLRSLSKFYRDMKSGKLPMNN